MTRPNHSPHNKPSALVTAEPSTCVDCAAQVGPRNKSGRCRSCIAKMLNAQPWFQEMRRQKCGWRARRTECASCGTRIGNRNRTGFCLPCFNRDPECASRRGAGVSTWRKRKMEDPEFAENARKHGEWLASTGAGNAAAPAGSESRKRAGKTLSDRYLGWCPEEYRAEYRRLLHNAHHSSETARAKILMLVERDRIARLTTFDNLNAAADYLRRYAPVFKRDDGYLYGTVTLTQEQLIRRALDKGWQPYRWAA